MMIKQLTRKIQPWHDWLLGFNLASGN